MSKKRVHPRAAGTAQSAARTYKAGCGRTWDVASGALDLAYTALEFRECAPCPHRVDSDGGGAFCTLRRAEADHPFAALAELNLPD